MTDVAALYALIAEDPSPANYLVLADALAERGDVRGELIHLHHALSETDEADPKHAELAARAEQLIREHAEVLGVPAASEHVQVQWRLGFPERVLVSGAAGTKDRTSAVQRLFAADSARFLRRLVLQHPPEDHTQYTYRDLLAALVEAGTVAPDTLHELQLGTGMDENSGYWVYGYFEECRLGDDLSQLWQVFPNLRRLRIDPGASFLTMGEIHAEQLRELQWIVPYFPLSQLEPLVKAKWPRLERFELWTGAEYLVNTEDELYGYDDGYVMDEEDDYDLADASDETIRDAAQLAPLFSSLDGLDSLRELGLCNYHGAWAELAEELSAHALWKRLRRLDISYGRLRAGDVEALVAACRTIDKLESLVAVNMQASDADLARLTQALDGVDVTAFADVAEELDPDRPPVYMSQFRYVVTQE